MEKGSLLLPHSLLIHFTNLRPVTVGGGEEGLGYRLLTVGFSVVDQTAGERYIAFWHEDRLQ